MKIHTLPNGPLGTNGYLVETSDGHFVIDAPEGLAADLDARGFSPGICLLTHQHFDHVGDAHLFPEIQSFTDCDRSIIMDDRARANFGLPITIPDFQVTKKLAHGETFDVCNLKFQALHVPGHSPDSLAFYLASEGLLFGGDTIFAGGLGRTDLPGGSEETLEESLQKHLFTLPGDTTVLPGHGPATTIAQER